MLATNAWYDSTVCNLALPYEPSLGDLEYGQLLMQQWQNLTMTGSVPGWESFCSKVD